MAADNCEMCGYLEYNEEMEYYECTMNLDEDEMYNFITGNSRECPYFNIEMNTELLENRCNINGGYYGN